MTASFLNAARSGAPGDFAPFYAAADVLVTRGPQALYDFDAIADSQRRHFPQNLPPLPFIRPPFYALLLAPFRTLAPYSALLVWMALNALALIVGALLTARATGLPVSSVAWQTAIFFPALATFLNRQDVPLAFLLTAATYALLAFGRSFAAGAVLALATIKFHLLLVVPLALLMRKNWRALWGFMAGTALLGLVSLWVVGPSGLAEYVGMLFQRGVPNFDLHPERFANLANLMGGRLQFPLVALVVGAVAVAARRRSLLEAWAVAWLGSLLVAPRIYVSDYLLALPACLLLARLNRLCFFASLLLLFPLVPVLMLFHERLFLAAPFLALSCVIGAAFLPARDRGRPARGRR